MIRFDKAAGGPNAAEILRSVGEAAYEWRLDTDTLIWSDNAAAVFGIADMERIDSGRSYAMRTDAAEGESRRDAVFQSCQE